MEKQEIQITVDSKKNKYNYKTSHITEEDLNKIMPLIKKIKKFKEYTGVITPEYMEEVIVFKSNYPNGDCSPREDMGEKTKKEIYPTISNEIFELFESFCPELDHGFHIVKSITICPIVEKEVLL